MRALRFAVVGRHQGRQWSGTNEANAADFLELAAYRRMSRARMTPIRDYLQNR